MSTQPVQIFRELGPAYRWPEVWRVNIDEARETLTVSEHNPVPSRGDVRAMHLKEITGQHAWVPAVHVEYHDGTHEIIPVGPGVRVTMKEAPR